VNHLTAAQAARHHHSPFAIAHLPSPTHTPLPLRLHFHLAALASSSSSLSLSEPLPSDRAANAFLDCILVAFVPLCPTHNFHYSMPRLSLYLERGPLSLHSLSHSSRVRSRDPFSASNSHGFTSVQCMGAMGAGHRAEVLRASFVPHPGSAEPDNADGDDL
jgi:hypothetical protein